MTVMSSLSVSLIRKINFSYTNQTKIFVNMAETTPKSLSDLPSTTLEIVFSFLTFSEVTQIRATCKRLYSICGAYLKRNIYGLKNNLNQCMYGINKRFVWENVPLDQKGILLRGYNMLEILKLSLNTLIVLNRHVLEKSDECLPIGRILDMFLIVMNAMEKNPFGHWPALGIILHNKIRSFTENMETRSPCLKDVIPLGVRVIDLLDMLMDARYEICVIYDIKNNMCFITACYTLADSRFLSYLPDISFISECKNRSLSEEESDIIMKYLVLLVNVHNGLLTKSEQYRRELEFSRKALLQNPSEYDHCFDSIKKLKRACSSYRTPVFREILDPRGEIIEIYNSFINECVGCACDEGVRAVIQIKCALDEAPLQIKESFGHLKNDIVLGEKSMRAIDPEIFYQHNPVQNSYGAAIKLEIRISNNNPQNIDLEFKDGVDVLFGNNLFDVKIQNEVFENV